MHVENSSQHGNKIFDQYERVESPGLWFNNLKFP